ncbi:hypothetical protein LTR78_005456 [Recurvomyces mirabilis]|uniref:Bromo domain-containing protein n=1 Tax=Recurvomyces mirabilis TaxID=574656 RepID=A0AAE0WMZ0_9PEZI|nr:hypothetical protein LTR78_005456 [Recurvomyces mirabilis]KAK5152637.1 hypothetical protein LTS14_008171 [Recurvomyces mirabilis]
MSAAQTNPLPVLGRTMSLLTRALAPRPPAMAKPPPEEEKGRSCIVCTDSPDDPLDLVRPCRACNNDYCKTCLSAMFEGATNDATRMPPRCCVFLQIHTAYLPDDVATKYRDRFEEWITRDKTYCPSPKCSAFIPERLLRVNASDEKAASIQEVMLSVLHTVTKSPHSRFFRGELPITEQTGNTNVVAEYMDLTIIRERVESGVYDSTVDMEPDMRLIVSNAKKYHGSRHPVALTANSFLETFTQALTATVDKLVHFTTLDPPQDHTIEHGSAPCDTTAQDHELAMLEQFRYKRCPLCKHAVKKMYGCSHMQCICGAHWCYHCQKSINECDGGCVDHAEDSEAEEAEENFDDEDVDDEDEDEEDEENEEDPKPDNMITVVGEHDGSDTNSPPLPTAAEMNKNPTPITAPSLPPGQLHRIVNLDAGGEARWANAPMNFGDEPEEDSIDQIWSCPHSLLPYMLRTSEDGVNRGDVSTMECNRCFCIVRPQPTNPGTASVGPEIHPPACYAPLLEISKDAGLKLEEVGDMAMECSWCYLVLCEKCSEKAQPNRNG